MSNYPTIGELNKVSEWKGTLQNLITYLQDIWEYEPPRLRNGRSSFDRKKVFKLSISTWGWSGNEDVIERLQTTMFWMTCWRSSHRGGHYEFEISPDFMYSPKVEWGDPRKPEDQEWRNGLVATDKEPQ